MDPDLKKHEAVLPRLIATLSETRPTVVIDTAFVHDLRASLLAYKPAPQAPQATTASPLFWWFTRLAPVGVAMVLVIALLPQDTVAPTPPLYPALPQPQAKEAGDGPTATSDEPSADSTATEMTMTMEAPSTALVVAPPLASTTLTITSVTLPQAGWVVVYKDAGGAFGEALHTSFLAAGTYTELSVPLRRSLVYPELVTVAIYTGNEPTAFVPTRESIQTDPSTDAPLTVTVPVVSELELQFTP